MIFKSCRKFSLLFSWSSVPKFATIISVLPRIEYEVTSSSSICVVSDLLETEYSLIFEIMISLIR